MQFNLRMLFLLTALASLGAAGFARAGLVGAGLALTLTVAISFGGACVYSAVVHRNQGWISGLVFGLFMLSFSVPMLIGFLFFGFGASARFFWPIGE